MVEMGMAQHSLEDIIKALRAGEHALLTEQEWSYVIQILEEYKITQDMMDQGWRPPGAV